jgi:trigger factor
MATITRENIGNLNEKITVKVNKEDYLSSFEKSLKEYGKKASLPGFRKGMVPTGVIRKMHGPAVFTDEVLRSVERELNNYMTAEKLEIFAQPLPMLENDSRQIDMNNPGEYAFAFEVGLKPAFNVADLTKKEMPFLKVKVTDEMIQEESNRLQLRHGKMTDPETTTCDDNVINVTFTECDASGNPTEGGIRKDNSLLLKYFSESYRPGLLGKKAGDRMVVQPLQAFDEKEREWVMKDLGFDAKDSEATSRYFDMEITKIGLVERATLDESFFKVAFPGREIADEAEFMEAVKANIQSYWDTQSRNHLQHELYHVLLEHTTIDFPETFLKRWLRQGTEQPKTPEEVEQEYPGFLNQLKWTLITDKVVRENNIEVSPDDLKDHARKQLFGYMGMQGLDEDQPWITEYVNRMMQDRKFVEDAYHRIQTEKVFGWAETMVKQKEKSVTVEEFTKELEKHQHHHH